MSFPIPEQTLNCVKLDRNKNLIRSGKADEDLPHIIMLHGWQQDHRSLQLLGDLLSASYHVHLPDLPGFGQSPIHDGTWGSEEYGECVYRYMKASGISKAIIMGHPFGARVALRLAHAHPEAVQSLIFIGGAGLPPIGWAKFKRSVKLLLNRLRITKFASKDYLESGALRKTLVKVVNEDLSVQAQGVKTPTLLLYGSRDTETPPSLGQRYHRLIAGSTYIELQGKDHNPFYGTGASLCAFYIQEFLSTHLKISK